VMNCAFMALLYSDCDGLSSPLCDFPSEGTIPPLLYAWDGLRVRSLDKIFRFWYNDSTYIKEE
jgi:hypothetical protein